MTPPKDLPIPQDDGACNHLAGLRMPDLSLESTSGKPVRLINVPSKTVFFFYPRTGRPEAPAPPDWDLIPGARGCTPQSCGFRDNMQKFAKMGISIYGISSQDTDYQKEFASRMNIPYEILSDKNFLLTDSLKLPTFQYNGTRLIKRLALYVEQGIIKKAFYPVFPPDRNADDILVWLKKSNSQG